MSLDFIGSSISYALLSETCLQLRRNCVCQQISMHIVLLNGGFVYLLSTKWRLVLQSSMSAVIHVVSLCLPPCSTNTRWLFCKMFELFSSSGKIPNISWSSTSRWSNLKSWQKEVITLISTVIKGSKIVHILQKI